MGLVTLDWGSEIDLLTKDELSQELAADRANRALIAGVKPVRYWAGVGTIGASVATFSTPPLVQAGYVWAVMNMGVEMSGSNNCLLYLMGSGATSNRAIGAMIVGGNTRTQTYSKGQVMVSQGEFITAAVAGGSFLLSLFIAAIEIPAERVGELLI